MKITRHGDSIEIDVFDEYDSTRAMSILQMKIYEAKNLIDSEDEIEELFEERD